LTASVGLERQERSETFAVRAGSLQSNADPGVRIAAVAQELERSAGIGDRQIRKSVVVVVAGGGPAADELARKRRPARLLVESSAAVVPHQKRPLRARRDLELGLVQHVTVRDEGVEKAP